jgi:hypothetical protein
MPHNARQAATAARGRGADALTGALEAVTSAPNALAGTFEASHQPTARSRPWQLSEDTTQYCRAMGDTQSPGRVWCPLAC